ncbi:MAG TPA: UDP-3-O-acyl-N-acetylglucosamine deacetylase [Methylomirabilota bacterium]|nr:UDP-3-O-acyl-N-acetylglucosamine deacetylase [Methylomirabilota bacterium]
MDRQKTIREPVVVKGIGLHTGKESQVTLRPAPAGHGIVFHHTGHATEIPARLEFVVDSHHATTLGVNGSRIRTVEHLLAATAGLGIDNLLIEVDGEEVPALDGSAREFVRLLEAVGTTAQLAPRQPLVITEPIRVGNENRWIQALPGSSFQISYTLDMDHPVVGTQAASFSVTQHVFITEVSGARTYGFLRDVPALWKQGLAQGGTLDNAVVVGKRKVLNGSLRFQDEFVRHKILDLIGDLSLLGRPLVGHVVARNAGHALNHQMVQAIRATLTAVDPSRASASARARRDGHPHRLQQGLQPLPNATA